MLTTTTINDLFDEVDYETFQTKAELYIQKNYGVQAASEWQKICKEINACNWILNEKFMFSQITLQYYTNPMKPGDLEKLIKLANEIHVIFGQKMFHYLFAAQLPLGQYKLDEFILAGQLVLELKQRTLLTIEVKKFTNNMSGFIKRLQELKTLQQSNITQTHSLRSIDDAIKIFAKKDAIVQCPLPETELATLKQHYIEVKRTFDEITNKSFESFKGALNANVSLYKSKTKPGWDPINYILGMIIEVLRQCNKVMLYDTQILAILALVHYPEMK